MLKFLRVPFAQSGDRATVPDAVVPGGDVSYTEGYGVDYARPKTDPLSKNIEREKMNQVFFDATTAIGELQAQGIPDFITTVLNGGTPFAYAKNALVRWTDGNVYTSLVTANTATPADATKWGVVDASLLTRLPLTTLGNGASTVGIHDAPGLFTGTNVEAALEQLARRIYLPANATNVEHYGASSAATPTVNHAAIMAAIAATPAGGTIYFPSRYQIDDELVYNKVLSFIGTYAGPSYVRASYAGLVQTTAGKGIFVAQATTAQYAFGQFGVIGHSFVGLDGEGPGGLAAGESFFKTDTSVNGGDYHIREMHFDRVSIRWLNVGIDLIGIAYLNNFFNCSVTYCDTGVRIDQGTASDLGGQTRFFGGFYGLNRVGMSLNMGTAGGDFGLHGVTVSENTEYGVLVDEEAIFYASSDCQFESNAIAALKITIAEANPNVGGPKNVGGKFISNGVDIWIDKTTSAFSGGGFHFPMRIDNAYLGAAEALRITVPAGHQGIDSPAFVLGRTISGPTGVVTASQISANFLGTDERKQPFAKRFVLPTTYVSGSVFTSLPFGTVLTSIRMYFTANTPVFSSITLGDQQNNSRYLSGINGNAVALNVWQNGALALPQLVIDGNNHQLRVIGTGGWGGAAVVEIEGYVVN